MRVLEQWDVRKRFDAMKNAFLKKKYDQIYMRQRNELIKRTQIDIGNFYDHIDRLKDDVFKTHSTNKGLFVEDEMIIAFMLVIPHIGVPLANQLKSMRHPLQSLVYPHGIHNSDFCVAAAWGPYVIYNVVWSDWHKNAPIEFWNTIDKKSMRRPLNAEEIVEFANLFIDYPRPPRKFFTTAGVCYHGDYQGNVEETDAHSDMSIGVNFVTSIMYPTIQYINLYKKSLHCCMLTGIDISKSKIKT